MRFGMRNVYKSIVIGLMLSIPGYIVLKNIRVAFFNFLVVFLISFFINWFIDGIYFIIKRRKKNEEGV